MLAGLPVLFRSIQVNTKGETMTVQWAPLDVVPESKGVCSSCRKPEHKPGEDDGHPYTVRVLPAGYVLNVVQGKCPICNEDLDLHQHLDLDLAANVVTCDRYDAWLYS